MKKIFTLLVFMSALALNAQSIKILNGNTPLNNGDTVFVSLDGIDGEISTYLGYQNLTDDDLSFRVRKEILLINEETTDIVFCLGECYTGNLSSVLTLLADETVASNDANAFHATYAGESDPAVVKFTFFLTDNENDQVSFYIAYGQGVSVKTVDFVQVLRAYPNPAVRTVNIDYAAPASNAYLVIKKLTGKEVYRAAVSNTGKKQVDISQFNAGVYLYGVEANGKMLCTKKLLVK